VAAVAKKVFPDGQVPCRCCGHPIGTTGVAVRYNKTCYGCAVPHNKQACADNRKATIERHTRLQNGITV
jgi:hypothetical protein